MATIFNFDTAHLPPVEWKEYLGQPLGIGVYLVAFYDGATEPDLSYEIGFSEPDGELSNASGVLIPGVWAVARLDDYATDTKLIAA